MKPTQAKIILLAWRPGRYETEDPLMAEALALARQDPELKLWLERHRAFQRGVTRTFRDVYVPQDLRDKILARTRVIRPVWWLRHKGLLAAAAALVLFLGLAAWWSQPASEMTLPTFRSRMVNTVLRQYAMDIVTNDMSQVRAFLAASRAPADYVLPDKLAKLPVSGAGVLSWRDQRVSMVCLDSPSQGTLFLFVVDRAALQQPPVTTREFEQVNKLMTVSWTQGGRAYVLAGSGGREALEQYF